MKQSYQFDVTTIVNELHFVTKYTFYKIIFNE